METKILEGLGEDQKKIEFSWTNQALKLGELEQRLHALQESVDDTAVENDKQRELFDSQVDKIFHHFYDKLDGQKNEIQEQNQRQLEKIEEDIVAKSNKTD